MTKDSSYIVVLIILAVIIFAIGIFAYAKSHNSARPHNGHRHRRGCRNSQWGCCNDGITTKEDHYGSNCSGGHNRNRKYGGDRDNHGCIKSAGYKWCRSLQKCIKPWEQGCP